MASSDAPTTEVPLDFSTQGHFEAYLHEHCTGGTWSGSSFHEDETAGRVCTCGSKGFDGIASSGRWFSTGLPSWALQKCSPGTAPDFKNLYFISGESKNGGWVLYTLGKTQGFDLGEATEFTPDPAQLEELAASLPDANVHTLSCS